MNNPFSRQRTHRSRGSSSRDAHPAPGDREALEHLIERHQRVDHNIAVRMLLPSRRTPRTQPRKILVKVLTQLSSKGGQATSAPGSTGSRSVTRSA